MSTTDRFDLVVIGTGVAASKIARLCREGGWRVAIVDAREFGGTCALRGCEPKKTLWTVAEAADRARRLAAAGLDGTAGLAIDWPALMAFKHGFTDPVPERSEKGYEAAGIASFHGSAKFIGPDTVAVGQQSLQAEYIVIATGARPRPVRFPGADLLASSEDFLDLPRLPRRMVMLGGGYVSFECAHIAARAGAEVVVVHADDRPLRQFDPHLVDRLVTRTREIGIRVELDCRAAAVERSGSGLEVRAEDGRRFAGDFVLHGLGRVPDLEALDLEAGNVATDDGRLRLDAHLRSVSNPKVFAAGDAAAQGPQLTPVASHDAEVVAENLLEGCRRTPDYTGVASVVFTIPPLASAGPTEQEAHRRGLTFTVRETEMSDYQSVRRTGETAAAARLLIGPDGCLIGAHLLGPEAEEVMNLLALAIRLHLPARDLGRLLSAYPSAGSNLASLLG